MERPSFAAVLITAFPSRPVEPCFGQFKFKVVFGTSVIKIPAKNAPEAMKISINDYKNNKQENETFGEYFDRMGKSYFRELLDPLKELPDIEQSPES